ncbi:MAG: 2-oxoglutarate dehydrogenase E1 component, partial [Deltaproteobacteria bacterium]|nr:2-oxoglutarate dehydrogenase E1 component [Deltaproteobacteria bacterium]
MDFTGYLDTDYIDAQYRLWKSDPGNVARDWQFFFKGFELGSERAVEPSVVSVKEDRLLRQSRVLALVDRYREIGHLLSCLDPLMECPTDHPLLSLAEFQLAETDLNSTFFTDIESDSHQMKLREIIQLL